MREPPPMPTGAPSPGLPSGAPAGLPPGGGVGTGATQEASTTRASRLREESALLAEAKASLTAGDGARALALVERGERDFPDGVLGQERQVLSIDALLRAGQRPAAISRARAFVEAHPRSAHAGRLRELIQ
jgi:outer membrane protein assembly factor BamD (BamD/ComL family)